MLDPKFIKDHQSTLLLASSECPMKCYQVSSTLESLEVQQSDRCAVCAGKTSRNLIWLFSFQDDPFTPTPPQAVQLCLFLLVDGHLVLFKLWHMGGTLKIAASQGIPKKTHNSDCCVDMKCTIDGLHRRWSLFFLTQITRLLTTGSTTLVSIRCPNHWPHASTQQLFGTCGLQLGICSVKITAANAATTKALLMKMPFNG